MLLLYGLQVDIFHINEQLMLIKNLADSTCFRRALQPSHKGLEATLCNSSKDLQRLAYDSSSRHAKYKTDDQISTPRPAWSGAGVKSSPAKYDISKADGSPAPSNQSGDLLQKWTGRMKEISLVSILKICNCYSLLHYHEEFSLSCSQDDILKTFVKYLTLKFCFVTSKTEVVNIFLSIFSCQYFPVNTFLSILSCQYFPVNTFLSILSCQYFPVNTFLSILSCQYFPVNTFLSILSCQYFPVNTFLSILSCQYFPVNTFLSILSCQYFPVNTFLSILSCQYFPVNTFLSILSCQYFPVNTFLSILSCQYFPVNTFLSILSCQYFPVNTFLSILSHTSNRCQTNLCQYFPGHNYFPYLKPMSNKFVRS